MQFYGTLKQIRAKSLFYFTGAPILCSLRRRLSGVQPLPYVVYSLICHTGAMHLQPLPCCGPLQGGCAARACWGALVPAHPAWESTVRKGKLIRKQTHWENSAAVMRKTPAGGEPWGCESLPGALPSCQSFFSSPGGSSSRSPLPCSCKEWN